MGTTQMTNLIEGLLALGLDITKAYKQHRGAVGYIDTIVSDKAVIDALKNVIVNIDALQSEFKELNMSEGLMLIGPTVRGVEAIVREATAS